MKKLELANLLEEANQAGMSMKKIADETGIPYASIRAFKDSLSLGLERRKKLEEWLLENWTKEARADYSPGQGVYADVLEEFAESIEKLGKSLAKTCKSPGNVPRTVSLCMT